VSPARPPIRALYVSSMAVTPRTGGGNAVFNVVEPPPEGSEAFYATLVSGPFDETVFPELASRVRTFPSGLNYLLPSVRDGESRRRLRSSRTLYAWAGWLPG
jgi:hypothetical protein